MVADAKVTQYLLNPNHAEGGTKARYFQRFGFSPETSQQLVQALLDHPVTNDIKDRSENEFGVKHVVECNVQSPDGRNPCIRTVWLIETGDDVHRLVTAVPITTTTQTI